MAEKRPLDQYQTDGANSADRAEELTQAAAESRGPDQRLWRLEWAQAFRRLSDIGKPKRGDDGPASPR